MLESAITGASTHTQVRKERCVPYLASIPELLSQLYRSLPCLCCLVSAHPLDSASFSGPHCSCLAHCIEHTFKCCLKLSVISWTIHKHTGQADVATYSHLLADLNKGCFIWVGSRVRENDIKLHCMQETNVNTKVQECNDVRWMSTLFEAPVLGSDSSFPVGKPIL